LIIQKSYLERVLEKKSEIYLNSAAQVIGLA